MSAEKVAESSKQSMLQVVKERHSFDWYTIYVFPKEITSASISDANKAVKTLVENLEVSLW